MIWNSLKLMKLHYINDAPKLRIISHYRSTVYSGPKKPFKCLIMTVSKITAQPTLLSDCPFIKLIDLPYRVNIPDSTATLHTR
jgi:hypothetical protein